MEEFRSHTGRGERDSLDRARFLVGKRAYLEENRHGDPAGHS